MKHTFIHKRKPLMIFECETVYTNTEIKINLQQRKISGVRGVTWQEYKEIQHFKNSDSDMRGKHRFRNT